MERTPWLVVALFWDIFDCCAELSADCVVDSTSLGLYAPGPGMPLVLRAGSGNRFLLGDQFAARELLKITIS